jgi:uncharacterized protein YbjT (DUF2867 family)
MATIVVVGATGAVGREVVRQAAAAGHRVRALVRAPERGALAGAEVVRGDVLDADAVARAVVGADAVIVTLGRPASDRSGLRAAGTRAVVAAMEAAGVRRLVCLSMLGTGDSAAGLDWFTRNVLFRFWLHNAAADHAAQEVAVQASRLDWTLARPPHFTERGATGRWTAGFAQDRSPPAMSIPRADLAAFLLDCAVSGRFVGEAVGVVKAVG